MPWGDNGDIYLPVDKYGRVLTKLDDGVRYAPAWVDGDNITNFDDASDSVLVNAMRDHGFIDALSYDDFSSITVNTLDGAPESISWSDDSNEFNVQIPLWANAAVTMSYKPLTLGDGSQIDCAVSDETGELIVWRDDNGDPRYCHVAHYDSGDALEWDNISDHPEIEEQTDGLRFIDIFSSVSDDFGETDTIVDAAGSSYFVVNTDQDGYYRDGSARIPQAPRDPSVLYAVNFPDFGESTYLGDYLGRAILLVKPSGLKLAVVIYLDDSNQWDFAEFVSGVEGLPAVEVNAEVDEASGTYRFVVNDVQYTLIEYGVGGPWLTPNNVVTF